jgi:hypothetical protein
MQEHFISLHVRECRIRRETETVLTAVAAGIPILRLDTNISIKPDIDASLAVSAAVTEFLSAHLDAVAEFLIGGAFGHGEVGRAGADVFEVANDAVVDYGFGLGDGEEDREGGED